MVTITNEVKKNPRINFLIENEVKDKWIKFIENNDDLSTLSKLIRIAVDNYIEQKLNKEESYKISKFAHRIKEELSSIKGYSKMLMDEFKDKWSFENLKKLSHIYQNSLTIENIINLIQNPENVEKQKFDVLIIDDNPGAIDLITDILKNKGLSYKTAHSGSSALELLKISKPKLILLDILLPGIDGYEICMKIKTKSTLKDIPVYYITAVTEEEVAEKLKETGAEGYILKPFEVENFNSIIQTVKNK